MRNAMLRNYLNNDFKLTRFAFVCQKLKPFRVNKNRSRNRQKRSTDMINILLTSLVFSDRTVNNYGSSFFSAFRFMNRTSRLGQKSKAKDGTGP